jgi:hypothetical protein
MRTLFVEIKLKIEQLRNDAKRSKFKQYSVRMFLYFIFSRDEERKNIHGIENLRDELCL